MSESQAKDAYVWDDLLRELPWGWRSFRMDPSAYLNSLWRVVVCWIAGHKPDPWEPSLMAMYSKGRIKTCCLRCGANQRRVALNEPLLPGDSDE